MCIFEFEPRCAHTQLSVSALSRLNSRHGRARDPLGRASAKPRPIEERGQRSAFVLLSKLSPDAANEGAEWASHDSSRDQEPAAVLERSAGCWTKPVLPVVVEGWISIHCLEVLPPQLKLIWCQPAVASFLLAFFRVQKTWYGS